MYLLQVSTRKKCMRNKSNFIVSTIDNFFILYTYWLTRLQIVFTPGTTYNCYSKTTCTKALWGFESPYQRNDIVWNNTTILQALHSLLYFDIVICCFCHAVNSFTLTPESIVWTQECFYCYCASGSLKHFFFSFRYYPAFSYKRKKCFKKVIQGTGCFSMSGDLFLDGLTSTCLDLLPGKCYLAVSIRLSLSSLERGRSYDKYYYNPC